jgi:hypothetical protein
MSGNSRLTLSEHARELRHGELSGGENGEDAQTRDFRGGAQMVQALVQAGFHRLNI